MIKTVITAPRGKMDRLIIKCAAQSSDIEVIGAVGPAGRDYIGEDAGIVAGTDKLGVPVYGDIEEIIEQCDIVVDFSTVELSRKVLASAVAHRKPLICGTTGFTEEDMREFEKAAEIIPLMKAANTSYIVQVMQKILELAAEKLSEKCKIEIIEMHDEKKVDAPSGTALELAHAMVCAGTKNMDDIDFHSVRAGDIPSSHTVLFGALGERLEITHHSYNWECYARGACDAIRFMTGKEPGSYTMQQVIG